MITKDLNCKVCARPITVSIDPDAEDHWIKVFCAIATCNRCFDAREKTNRLIRAVEITAGRLNVARVSFNTGGRTDKETENYRKESERAAKDLAHLTKRYTRALCEYFMAPPEWSKEMVDIIMEMPWHATKVLVKYRTMLAHDRKMPVWNI